MVSPQLKKGSDNTRVTEKTAEEANQETSSVLQNRNLGRRWRGRKAKYSHPVGGRGGEEVVRGHLQGVDDNGQCLPKASGQSLPDKRGEQP